MLVMMIVIDMNTMNTMNTMMESLTYLLFLHSRFFSIFFHPFQILSDLEKTSHGFLADFCPLSSSSFFFFFSSKVSLRFTLFFCRCCAALFIKNGTLYDMGCGTSRRSI
jgi:hypothetical protein